MQTTLPPSDIQEEDMNMMHTHRAPYPHCFNSSSIEMHQPIMNASQQHPSLGIYSQQNMFCGSSSSVYGNTAGDTITDKMRNMADIPRHGRQPRMSSGKGQDAPQSSKSEPKPKEVVSADEPLLLQRLNSQCHQGRIPTHATSGGYLPAATSGGYLPLPQLNPKKQFPDKLYDMLEVASSHGFEYASNAVSWMPHGRSFKVFDEDVFMTCIVPVFFKQTKLRSFNRQLNLWGFKRLTMGHDAGGWYHESFVRGSPNKLKEITRTKIKGTTMKSAGTISDLTEPDFYNLPSSMPCEGEASVMPAEQFPEHSLPRRHELSRRNSCPNISMSLNESVYGFNSVVTHPRSVPSKSRRRVSVESMGSHFNESFANPVAQNCDPTANTHHLHDRGQRRVSVESMGSTFNENFTSLHDRGQECLEPLPFKNDAGFDDLVRCIDNVIDAL